MLATFNVPLIYQAVTNWEYHPSGDISRGQCICGQAFSFRGRKKVSEELRIPGPPNERLGEVIRKVYQQTGLPISAQGELVQSEALSGIHVEKEIFHHHISGKYVSCYEIETQTWKWMQENGWTRVVIATHPLLVWRMQKVFEKLGAEVIIPPGLEVVGYDPKGTQWRAHNETYWRTYEFLARGHHVLMNWI